MKKSVLFLLNGLGIEKAGSYSISIDQCMPKFSRVQETSYYTSSIINSLELRSAYQEFFLGDTFYKEIKFLEDNVFNINLEQNPVFQSFCNSCQVENSKVHIFLEPTNDRIVELINELANRIPMNENKRIYLHLLLTQQTISDYKGLINTINFIKFHLNHHISVGFVIGKEAFSDELTSEELIKAKKMFFYSSCERWAEVEKKLAILRDENTRPCVVPGFCATNDCVFGNNDTIFFFNTKRTTYDKFIDILLKFAPEVFRVDKANLPIFSLIHLDSKYNIPFFSENVFYETSLSNLLKKSGKKALIITDESHFQLLNFLANGLNYVSNPAISFMKFDYNYLSNINNVVNLIDNSNYDFIIFDTHMDVSSTINNLKAQLERIDMIIGNIADTCVNKHSLFISSLYGLKKEMPLADYNTEMVTIDYEMQIPIFFFDYSYPRSKYTLVPGDTNSIMSSCIRLLCDDSTIPTLVRPKGLLNNLFGGK